MNKNEIKWNETWTQEAAWQLLSSHFPETDCFEHTQKLFTNIFASCFQNCQKTKIVHYSHSFARKLHDCKGHRLMGPPAAVFHLILLVQLWIPIGLATLKVQNILWITLGTRT